MSPNGLLIGWGEFIPGREELAFAVFAEAIQFFTQAQSQGRIDAFETAALEPHAGDLLGFILLRGDDGKLRELRSADDFISLVSRARAVVQNVGVVSAFTDAAIQGVFDLARQAIADATRQA